MYINSPNCITNTPSNFTASYNTWTYVPNSNMWYQKVPYHYINHEGKVKIYNSWNPPEVKHISGGQYKGTPTRTGSFYIKNTIV